MESTQLDRRIAAAIDWKFLIATIEATMADVNLRVLDLDGFLVARTEASCSFNLGKPMKTIHSSGRTMRFPNEVFCVIGSLIVQYPCNGHIKLIIDVSLDEMNLTPRDIETYFSVAALMQVVSELRDQLRIPHDETFTATFRGYRRLVTTEERIDREGISDIE